MAKPHRLKEIAAKFGPPEDVIPAKVNELGGSLKATAEFFGLSHATIVHFMQNHGYIRVTKWVKAGEAEGELQP